jgi:hypothetical protein
MKMFRVSLEQCAFQEHARKRQQMKENQIIPIMPYYSKNGVNTTDLASLIGNSIFTPNSPSGFVDIKRHCFELPVEYAY